MNETIATYLPVSCCSCFHCSLVAVLMNDEILNHNDLSTWFLIELSRVEIDLLIEGNGWWLFDVQVGRAVGKVHVLG